MEVKKGETELDLAEMSKILEDGHFADIEMAETRLNRRVQRKKRPGRMSGQRRVIADCFKKSPAPAWCDEILD